MNATELAQITCDPSGRKVLELLSVLETKKVDNLLNIWHEEGMIEFPFSHKSVPGLEHPKLIGLQVIYKVF
jgi:hypothetical protein